MMVTVGVNNRVRRRMKQKRRRDHRGTGKGRVRRSDATGAPSRAGAAGRPGGGWGAFDLGADVDTAIAAAAHADCDGQGGAEDRQRWLEVLADGLGMPQGRYLVAERASRRLRADMRQLLHDGWEPDDLVRIVRRRVSAGAATAVITQMAAVVPGTPADAASTAGTAGAAGDPSAVAGSGRALDPDHPSWHADLVTVVDALGLLEHLPSLPDLSALRSLHRRAARSTHEERVLARIRGLLAKAESSQFPEEADVCMAKAQELMTRHCLEGVVAPDDADRCGASGVDARRIWLDDPYLQAKALLLGEAAAANRCRAVVTPAFGFTTVVGCVADLEATELLFTSLLVQATRRMAALGSDGASGPRARRPSFRRSFLVSYAHRIGTRLREVSTAATTEADEALGKRLLPVLTRREEAVDAAFHTLFSDLSSLDLSVTDMAGWAAGTAAADLADLAARDTLSGAAPA